MFTGIIKEVGEVKGITSSGSDRKLEISCDKIAAGMEIGDSISVDGVCLTVTHKGKKTFKTDVSSNTLGSTALGQLNTGSKVNLEDSLRISDKIGGHLVTGHIDTTVRLLGITRKSNSYILTVELPEKIRDFVAPNGSVSLNGISLTVVDVKKDSFTVYIIPHTFKSTNMDHKESSDILNIECDILSRYAVNFLNNNILGKKREKDNMLKEKLIEYGFYE